jgi:phage terminase large subunit GpA-like protein
VLEGAFARKGQFSLVGSRYLELPFALLTDDRVRMLNLAKAPQTAGSLVAEIYLQFVFCNRPGPFMMTFQSDDDAEEHYATRIEPTFLKTEPNREMFMKLRKRRALYRWPHMSLFIQGANMNSLQSKSIRYEWNDEVWRWRPGLLEEAWKRTHAFRRVCKILNISQGGLVGTDWEECWEGGRRYENGVRCENPACDRLQPLSFCGSMVDDPKAFDGIVWDRRA